MRWRGYPNKKKQQKPIEQQISTNQSPDIYKNLAKNSSYLASVFEGNPDVIFHSFVTNETEATLVYMDGLTNVEKLDEQVLMPLLNKNSMNKTDLINSIKRQLPITNVKVVENLSSCVDEISVGNSILLLEGQTEALVFGLTKFEKRSVEEPEAETAIRGPREGFTESLQVNTSLVRRIIKSPELKMKSVEVGKYTKTKIVITYMESLADPSLIKELENRLGRIDVDGVLESGYIEQYIEDKPYSPFPQLLYTERPDVVSANLLEGRAVLIINGTPFALIAPVSLFSLLQSPEDYYERFWLGTFVRSLRFIFLVVSLFFPSLYVAIISYHHELIPTFLMLSIASSREGVPFPAIIEALMMEIAFEALREAGIRLPKQVGSAVSIVGALVIGQAAVQAGIVSAPMIIVVSITGIASFLLPRYSFGLSIRLLRFPIILLAGSLGLIGIMIGFILIIIHLASLKSFGVPYLSPVATLQKDALKDTVVRSPLWKMNKRPRLTNTINNKRQGVNLKPGDK